MAGDGTWRGLLRRMVGLVIGLLLVTGARSAPFHTGSDRPDPAKDYYAGDPELAAYIDEALQRNPALQEALARYRASLQKATQVSALPDPMLNFTQFVRSVETRVGPQVSLFSLSQKFPWFGKLDIQGQMAVKEAFILYQQFRALERETIAQVKRAYYELLYFEHALRITRQEELLLDHYERLAQSRYSAGQGLQQAVVKIQSEITRLIDRIKLFDQQRESLIARLNTLMSRRPEAPLAVVEIGELPPVELDLEDLYALGEKHRPELRASLARIERGELGIELAKKDYWPDLTVSAGFINVQGREDAAGIAMPPPDNGKNAFNFSIGVNLPIWRNKYRAEVVEATENVIASRRNYLDIRNGIDFSIRDQVLRIQTLKDQLDLYDTVLIPQAEEALRSTESAYETGQVGAIELLDSERFLLSARLTEERYRIDYLKALAELERALGTRFPR